MRTVSEKLRLDNPNDYRIVLAMCEDSRRIYNSALYTVRKHYQETKLHLNYNQNDKIQKSENTYLYRRLHSNCTQAILRKIEASYTSFRGLLKLKAKGEYQEKVKPPYYIKDKGLFNVWIGARALKEEDDGRIRISLSKFHRNRFEVQYLYVTKPKHIKEPIREIEIKPLGYKNYRIEFKYKEKPVKKPKLNKKENLSIDLGLGNLASCVTTLGDAFIIDGKKLKSINNFWNKEIARLRSQKDKEKHKFKKMRLDKQMLLLTQKRNRRVKDYMHKASTKIIDYCVFNEIGSIVIGHNKSWKDGINIGKKNNQRFVAIPHKKLIDYITYKAEALGIKVITQEESYTSKCDSLALEPVQKQEKYKGRRTKRGLFKSSTGKCINADINGAINILRKALKSKRESKLLARITSKGKVFFPMQLAIS